MTASVEGYFNELSFHKTITIIPMMDCFKWLGLAMINGYPRCVTWLVHSVLSSALRYSNGMELKCYAVIVCDRNSLYF